MKLKVIAEDILIVTKVVTLLGRRMKIWSLLLRRDLKRDFEMDYVVLLRDDDGSD